VSGPSRERRRPRLSSAPAGVKGPRSAVCRTV
jgi:hypothetical protein